VGLKPTYGRVSRWGLVAFASSLDQIGPLARSVAGVANLLETIAGPDARDSTCADRPVPPYAAALTGEVRACALGCPASTWPRGCSRRWRLPCERPSRLLSGLGAQVVEVSLPHTDYALPAYYLIAPAEASANLARYDGMRYGLRVAGEEGPTAAGQRLWETYCQTRGVGPGPRGEAAHHAGNLCPVGRLL
jgi:aspartyl-tRNA(Asn)/glutamyl-tRNA(Gln) amidotransferase subunit A